MVDYRIHYIGLIYQTHLSMSPPLQKLYIEHIKIMV